MTKITTEQKQIMHELLDFAIECKESNINLWFEFVPHVNWIEIRHQVKTAEWRGYETLYSKILYFKDLTQETLTQIKNEVLAIINEVDISEITDKSQNHGC